MRCTHCGYSLWNLPEPRCPECGKEYDLRTYRFKPGSVAFACPCCGHLHGGTGPQYLPSATKYATCLNCRERFEIRRMRIVPLTENPSDAEATSLSKVPWQDRSYLGWWRAWWRTTIMSLVQPHRLGDSINRDTAVLPGIGYALTTHALAFVTGFGVLFLFIGLIALLAGGGGGTQSIMMFLAYGIGISLVSALAVAGVLVVYAGIIHLLLRITGPTRLGYRTTLATLSYAQGPAVIAAVPLLGLYIYGFGITWVWSAISAGIALTRAQDVAGWRATLAVIVLPAIVLAILLSLFVLMILFA